MSHSFVGGAIASALLGNPVAFAAVATPLRVIGVGVVKCVAGVALGLRAVAVSPLVLCGGNRLQVGRVHTAGRKAEMVNLVALRDGTNDYLIGDAMGLSGVEVHGAKLGVAGWKEAPYPKPTGAQVRSPLRNRAILVNLRPKASLWGNVLALSRAVASYSRIVHLAQIKRVVHSWAALNRTLLHRYKYDTPYNGGLARGAF